ncbi:alpha/beta fold hydrolase [Roseovarius nanhaiticus]|uniref:alpha/beta fold hydrolase n=1 Tax=Roseovarius nanhaiticus TaxID=573024 RepID=UPI00249328BB|nr:alpha/beta hydrolase [Roseovarius nanhaiticus]
MPRGAFGGFPTYWTTFGQGPRAALMIHCSLAETAIWGGMARELSGAATMIAFDQPGHGRSADWDGRGELSAICTDIAADFAERDAPMDVIGHSFGGVIALRLAMTRPDLVRSLVMIEPVFFAAALRDGAATGVEQVEEMAAFEAAMQTGDLDAAARGFISAWGGGRPWDSFAPEAQARIRAQMPVIASTRPALYDDAGGLLAPGALEALQTPVLLLEGSEAPDIIPAINGALAARLPNARRGVIGGAGHMSVATHSAQVGAEVLRFWRET